MASTYSTNLAIELIGTGDQAGSWGNTTNTNLGTLIEQAISGYVTQAVSTGTDTTITIPNGATGVARNMYIELTGTGGTNTNLIVPANKKLYFIFNNSTGAVTVKVSGQTGVSVPNGKKMVLVSNGTDIVNAANYVADFGSNSATITQLTSTSATITNLTLTSLVLSNLSIASANVTTLTSASATITNLLATSLTVSGNTFLATSSGNVGIGTSSPTEKLDVSGNAAVTGTGYLALQRPLIPPGENGIPPINFRMYSTGTTYEIGASIAAGSEAGWTSTSTPARLMFSTTPSGSTTPVERLRITATGRLFVGSTTAPSGDSVKLSLVGGSSTTQPSSLQLTFNGGTYGGALIGAVEQGGGIQFYTFTGNVGSESYTERARISSDGTFRVKGAGTAGSTDAFQVSGSAPADAARITSGGNWYLGATSGLGADTVSGQYINSGSYVPNGQVTQLLGRWVSSVSDNNGSGGCGIELYRVPRGGGIQSGAEIRFYTGYTFPASTTAEVARLTQNGDLLVGSTSGSERIYAATSSGNCYVSSNRASKSTGQVAFRLGGGTSGTDWIIYQDTNSDTLKFFGDSNDRMSLLTNGNLGVGTTSPTRRLSLNEAASTQVWTGYSQNNSEKMVVGLDASGNGNFLVTANAPAIFSTNNTERGRFSAGGYFKASNTGGYDSATGTYHELLNNDADDYILVATHFGATNPQGFAIQFTAASPDNNTQVFLRCADNTTARCIIYSDGDLANHDGVYGTISDERLKQDIVDAGSQWDDLKAIRFRKYRMKTDVEANPDAPAMFGVVAQELAQVCPGLVDEHPNMKTVEVTDEEGNVTQTQEPDGTTTMTVKSSILLMKAAKALQEAMARIESLEADVAALKGAK